MALGHWQNRVIIGLQRLTLCAASGLEKLEIFKGAGEGWPSAGNPGGGDFMGWGEQTGGFRNGDVGPQRGAAGLWRGIRILKTGDSPWEWDVLVKVALQRVVACLLVFLEAIQKILCTPSFLVCLQVSIIDDPFETSSTLSQQVFSNKIPLRGRA